MVANLQLFSKPIRYVAATLASAIVLAFGPAHALQPETTPSEEQALPGVARDLIDAAARKNDPERIRNITEDLTSVFPSFQAGIEAYAAKNLATLPTAVTDSAVASNASDAPEPSEKEQLDVASTEPTLVEPKKSGILSGWDGDANFGASFASGNSDNVAIGGAFEAAKTVGILTHDLRGYFDLGESEGVVNQRRWGVSYKLDFALSERSYAFIRAAYDEDEFSGFDYRLFAGGGAGYFLAKSDPFTLSVEAGPGFRYSPIDDTTDIDEEIALFGAIDLDWVIREGLKFEQDVSVTWTDPTTTTESQTQISTQLFENLSAGLAFNFRFETNPPEGRVRTDRVFRATLGYSF
ncbi:MAG: DUF481 domain-containing protein [Pseudomonadota bacterium]